MTFLDQIANIIPRRQPRAYSGYLSPVQESWEDRYLLEASVRVAWRIYRETGVTSRLEETRPGSRVMSFSMTVGVLPGQLTSSLMKRLEDKGMIALLQAELNTDHLVIQRRGAWWWFTFPHPYPSVMTVAEFRGEGVCVPLGLDRQGETVDMDFDATPHLLVVGPTNIGKTNIGRLIAYYLAAQNAPRDLRMVVVTASLDDWRAVAMLPHCWGIVEHEDALQALTELRQEGKDRKKHGRKHPRIVVILDDMKSLVTCVPDIGEIIDEAARQWRAPRMHLVVLAQGTTAEDLGGPAVDKNIVRRLVGSVASAGDAARMTGRKGTGAELLLGTGEAISVGDGLHPRAMTIPKVEDRDFDELAARLDHGLVEAPPWETGAWRRQWGETGETARNGETAGRKVTILAPEGFRTGQGETGETVSPVSPAMDPVEAEVCRLVQAGTSKVKVIEAVWNAKPGKGNKYVQASAEYERIVAAMLREALSGQAGGGA